MLSQAQEALLAQFQTYLEEEGIENGHEEEGERVDLYTLFGEMSALKNEVRIESRQVKEALDQFRALVEPLQTGHAALQGEIERLRNDRRHAEQEALRPLLLELLELRDRMASGLEMTLGQRSPKKRSGRFYHTLFHRFSRKSSPRGQEMLELWREGQSMILRRLDQTLAAQDVYPLEVVTHPLNPRLARAVRVEHHEGVKDGEVLAELRKGFLWQGALLRAAEVVVNKSEE